jgi:TolB-like protein/DNA-binding winged helix-turn-helix (wHTH) protein/Tfp pilus assembly protein PilF
LRGTADIFLFEGFRLDRPEGGLFRQGERGVCAPVAVGRRALDVLEVLLQRPGVLVSKDEIMEAVWPHTIVENANLTIQISALRRALDQGRPDGSCIQTVAAQGYRFIGPVTRLERANSIGKVAPPGAADMARATAFRRRLALAGVSATVAAALLVVIITWWVRPAPTASADPPRLSIVVLPFANLGENREQQYLADAIADDVTSDLSRIAGLFVISRNTAFTYRDRSVDTKQIGRELGIHYVLEGSVRRSSHQLRVDTQLIDAETDAHLWAGRFDGDTGDLFAVQNEITGRMAVALNAELVGAEAARPMERPDALNYLMRGRAALWKSPTAESYAEAVGFFERVLKLEPSSVEAQGLLASTLSARAIFNLGGSGAADIASAETLVGQALAASPLSPTAHYAKGQLLYAQRRCDEAIPEFETAITFNPNSAWAIALLGCCKFWVGSIDEAIPLLERAVRLSPRDPQIGYLTVRLGLLHLLQSNTDEAIVWLKKARSTAPALPFVHLFLASAYGLKGETERAGVELMEVSRLHGPGHVTSVAELRANLHHGPPNVATLFETILFTGLRKAGLADD